MSRLSQRAPLGDDGALNDTGAVLSVPRPQSPAEWDAWHTRRERARRVIASYFDGPDETLMLALLGLDPAGEAAELERLGAP